MIAQFLVRGPTTAPPRDETTSSLIQTTWTGDDSSVWAPTDLQTPEGFDSDVSGGEKGVAARRGGAGEDVTARGLSPVVDRRRPCVRVSTELSHTDGVGGLARTVLCAGVDVRMGGEWQVTSPAAPPPPPAAAPATNAAPPTAALPADGPAADARPQNRGTGEWPCF